MFNSQILIILGPTATGKTKLAVKLAQKFNGEIISADSRQVYKWMNIGSGKDLDEFKVKGLRSKAPTKGLLNPIGFNNPKLIKIPYHLIDIVSPNTEFNVAKFQKLVYKAIDDILSRGKLPIIVGGTGLYISAVVDGLAFDNSKIKNQKLKIIREKLEKLSLKQLLARLKKIDLTTYNIIDQNNRHRVQRAVEIFYQTGKPKSQQPENKPRYDCLQIGLTFPREIINERIDLRLKQRLKGGAMIKEVENLHNKHHVSWKRLESFGLEYRWLSLYLKNKISYNEMKEKLAQDIKHFAKRQMTWFKRDQRIIWESDYKKTVDLIKKFIK